ncbi:peptidoglycan recognition protein family protein [Mycolicibacter sinensis]
MPLTGPDLPSETAPPSPNPPVAEPMSPSGVLLCRDAWGARPALPGGRPLRITRMTIHHSGVVFSDNRTIAERLRQHQRYHQDEHGWIDIAYHVGIDRGGNVFALRDTGLIGDTATDYDPTGHFLVLCEGDFDQQDVPEAQLESAALVLAWAAQTFQISTDTLASHREVAPATTCPGANLQVHIASGELRRRVDDLASRGPVGLALKCRHEAAATMAAIAAGR